MYMSIFVWLVLRSFASILEEVSKGIECKGLSINNISPDGGSSQKLTFANRGEGVSRKS